jgi:hypothetical protein
MNRTALLCSVFVSLTALPVPLHSAPEERREITNSPAGQIERVYRDGVLAEERRFAPDGGIEEESIYSGKDLVQKSEYRRVAGRLMGIEASDLSGAPIGSIKYRYDGAGKLISVETSGIFGSGGAGLILASGSPQAAWTRMDGQYEVRRFDEGGRPLILLTNSDGKPVSRETRTYGSGPFPLHASIEDLVAGTVSAIDYDERGMPILRVDSAKGKERARISSRYGSDGHLAEETTRTAASVVVRKYTYDSAGALAGSEEILNGNTSKTVTYSGDARVEDLFRNGKLFARVSYLGGRKVKEEFFDGGSVVRSRNYP